MSYNNMQSRSGFFFDKKTTQHSQQTDAQSHLLALLRTTKSDKRKEDITFISTIWLNLK